MSTLPEPMLPEALRTRLASLPVFAPDARLDARIDAILAAPVTPLHAPRARRSRWLPLAAAAGMGAIAVIAWQAGFDRGHDVATIAAADPGIARAQALEAEVMTARAVAAAGMQAQAAEAELARIDQALQSAYDRGAGSDEIATLWRAREDALRHVLDAYRAPASLIQI